MWLLLGSCENNSKLDLYIIIKYTILLTRLLHYLQLRSQKNVEDVAVHLQMELIDLQCNTDSKTKFTGIAIVQFYEHYVQTNQFARLMHHARMIIALFGSTYLCEMFIKVIFAKRKTPSKLTDAHLEGTLRLASTHL